MSEDCARLMWRPGQYRSGAGSTASSFNKTSGNVSVKDWQSIFKSFLKTNRINACQNISIDHEVGKISTKSWLFKTIYCVSLLAVSYIMKIKGKWCVITPHMHAFQMLTCTAYCILPFYILHFEKSGGEENVVWERKTKVRGEGW